MLGTAYSESEDVGRLNAISIQALLNVATLARKAFSISIKSFRQDACTSRLFIFLGAL